MATNASLIPSVKDLLLVFPRLAHLLIDQLPEGMDAMFGNVLKNSSDAVVANVTVGNVTATTIAQVESIVAAQTSTAAHAASDAVEKSGFFSWMTDLLQFEGVGFGGMLSYFSSRWALATFAVVSFPCSTCVTSVEVMN